MGKTQIFGKIAPLKSHFNHRYFCLVPFESNTILVRFSPFRSKMNEINGAEQLYMNLDNFISLEYH
jgi:hypothetical protein